MCGRFTVSADPREIAQHFDASSVAHDLMPRYNVAPSQPVPVVRLSAAGARRIDQLRWGLIPSWAKDPSIGQRLINARVESLHSKPAFREALQRRRCLIVTDGFYEWQRTPGGKQPYLVRLAGGGVFAFAGLWERWSPGDSQKVDSCVIVTTDASDQLRRVHDRMPLIVQPKQYEQWLAREPLDEGVLADLAASCAEHAMELCAVSRRVNNPGHDDAECIEPLPVDEAEEA